MFFLGQRGYSLDDSRPRCARERKTVSDFLWLNLRPLLQLLLVPGHGISFKRFPRPWETVGPISGPSHVAVSSLALFTFLVSFSFYSDDDDQDESKYPDLKIKPARTKIKPTVTVFLDKTHRNNTQPIYHQFNIVPQAHLQFHHLIHIQVFMNERFKVQNDKVFKETGLLNKC